MGRRGSPVRSHSRKVSPSGASQGPSSERTHITGASRTCAAQAARGSASSGGASDRTGSIAVHTACREERQSVRLPSCQGELANAATRTAPRRWARRQRRPKPSGPGSSYPASRHTWTEAEAHIMARPAGPVRSKWASMASYRGSCRKRRGGCHGSWPSPVRVRSLARRAARTAVRSAATESMHSMRESAGSELSSSWPPGSTVSADRRGSALNEAYAAASRWCCTGTCGSCRS